MYLYLYMSKVSKFAGVGQAMDQHWSYLSLTVIMFAILEK